MQKNYYVTRHYGNSKCGKKWDDGTFSGIRRITMTTTSDTLTSLKVTYALEGHEPSIRGKEFGGLTHGGPGDESKEFILDFPREYLIKISGYVDRAGGERGNIFVIKSLSFETNKRKLGPCGPEEGTPFETDADGVIVGLFGTATNSVLNSVGAYMLLD